MTGSHTWRPNDHQRCPQNEWRMVRFQHTMVRSLVQCSLPRNHEGNCENAKRPFTLI